MARKTKEEAAATRDSILDAAEHLFAEQGVSRTTLQHIATAAGVTRGAIYWHFDDKVALFNAMMDRVVMPLEAALALLERCEADDPLQGLREYLLGALRTTVEDPRARRVFEIAVLKMELVGELDAARIRRKRSLEGWMLLAERRISEAADRGQVRKDVDPHGAALAMWSLVDGLIRNWLFEPAAFDLVEVGTLAVDVQIKGLRE
jgi:TetR/AcrR family transcriptional regulator, acrAB operon repressor